MSVTVNVDEFKIRAKADKAWERTVGVLSMQIRDDCNQYVKYAEGALLESSLYSSMLDEGLIIWQTPYAKRQYWEIETAYQTTKQPKATWKWCEVAKQHHLDRWVEQAQRLIARNYHE